LICRRGSEKLKARGADVEVDKGKLRDSMKGLSVIVRIGEAGATREGRMEF
jgi:hypothetical protein